MNWQRGSFRVWIVASVAWIGVTTAVAVGSIRNVSAPIVLHDRNQELEFPGNISKPLMKKAVLGYLRDRDSKRSSGDLSDEQVGLTSYDSEADKLMAGYEPRDLWSEILHAIGVVVSLPLVLLIAGLSVRWIVAGFKTVSTN